MTDSIKVRVFEFDEDLFDFPSRFEAGITNYREGASDFVSYGSTADEAIENAVKLYWDARTQDSKLERYSRVAATAQDLGEFTVEL